MILELDISMLERLEQLSLGQLVFLSLVLSDNQIKHQAASQILSLIKEDEIQELIDNDFISIDVSTANTTYNPTDSLLDLLKEERSMFDEFYEEFPTMVFRPDGTKGYLRANINKCRRRYNQIVGKSKAMHQHLMDCLRFETKEKTFTGKLGYMKTMWKWLVNNEWEAIEEQMMNESQSKDNYESYGTKIL